MLASSRIKERMVSVKNESKCASNHKSDAEFLAHPGYQIANANAGLSIKGLRLCCSLL